MNDQIRLLYAEDDPRDADLTQTHFALEAPEFEIEIVDTGQACLERLAQNNYDLLLLDYRLPDMDGVDIVKTLAQQGFPLPVVLVTGAGDEDLVVRAIRLGASDYVPKRGDYLAALPQTLRSIAEEHRRKKKTGPPLVPSQRRILYVEHDPLDVDLTLQHFAQAAPHLIMQVARSCGEALELLREVKDTRAPAPYDLALTDLRMPDMSALEFYREAKHRGMALPFVIVTGKGEEDTAVAVLKMGAYDYVVKREEYLTQLPYIIDNAIARFQLDQMASRLQAELAELNRSLEQKVKERTAELEQEIDERKRAEEEVRRTAREWQTTFDTTNDSIWILDQGHRILRSNKTAERVFQRPYEELVGKRCWEIVHGAAQPIPECPVLRARHSLRRETMELQMGEGWFEITVDPILDTAGRYDGAVHIVSDITERKRAETARDALLRFQNEMLDTAAVWIDTLDAAGNVTFWNRAAERISGYSRDEVLGHGRIWEWLYPDAEYRASILTKVMEIIQKGARVENFETLIRRKDGEYRTISWYSNNLVDETGQVVGSITLGADVTARKWAEEEMRKLNAELEQRVAERTAELTQREAALRTANEELERLSRIKSEFVSNVSHELRTPLTNIKGYLGLLERGKPEKRGQYMETLHRESDLLQRLIEDLLHLSRLDLGKVKPALAPVDVNQMVTLLVGDRALLFADRGLKLQAHVEPGLPLIQADEKMLIQVLANLMTNAMNYTPAGGVVTVSTGLRYRDWGLGIEDHPQSPIPNPSTWVTFSVADTGPGISVEDQPRLFERFYRGEAAHQTQAPGTGLGLAICQELAERHAGRITVESQVGQGSAFTVWLPVNGE